MYIQYYGDDVVLKKKSCELQYLISEIWGYVKG